MALNKYEQYPIPRPKNMPKSKTWRCHIYLATKLPSHQSKKVKMLDTIFNIQTIGCYSFQSSHPICFSFSRVGAISLIN